MLTIFKFTVILMFIAILWVFYEQGLSFIKDFFEF